MTAKIDGGSRWGRGGRADRRTKYVEWKKCGKLNTGRVKDSVKWVEEWW